MHQIYEQYAVPVIDSQDNTTSVDRILTRVPTEIVAGYIADVARRDNGISDGNIRQLLDNGNAAFQKIPHVPLVQTINIPAAVARERQLDVTLYQAQAQQENAPGSIAVVVSANYPVDQACSRERLIGVNIDIIEAAKCDYDVPISYFIEENPPGRPIGDIRERLNNTSILAYAALMRDQDRDPIDILQTGWDADTLKAYQYFCGVLQAKYSTSTMLAWSAYPEFVFHVPLDREKFPRINTVINWLNLGTRFGLVELDEQHFTQNLGGYAKGNGFRSQASGEHANM